MALVRLCLNVLKGAKTYVEPCILVPKRLSTAHTQLYQQRVRNLSVSLPLWCEQHADTGLQKASEEATESTDPAINRYIVVPVETSIEYLESQAYQETYGEDPVWKEYRRNHKGPFPPKKTRKTCIRSGQISTGNPCPICRDEYLTLDYRNVKLLKQFICPFTGSILSYSKTGLCQKKHLELMIAIQKARDYGFLTYDVPRRVYDYSQYVNL